jgi:hypothetical protein
VVDLPAPDGPTSATICPGWTVNDTPRSTSADAARSRIATSSSDASDTSAALGYRNRTSRNSTRPVPDFIGRAFAGSAIDGCRSSTSKTRSNDTSALITSTRTFDRAVSGP